MTMKIMTKVNPEVASRFSNTHILETAMKGCYKKKGKNKSDKQKSMKTINSNDNEKNKETLQRLFQYSETGTDKY